jgi:hypothetical protein
MANSNNNTHGPYHRTGGPGGEGDRLSVLPIQVKSPDGSIFEAQLLDAGVDSTEVGLLRTLVEKMGIKWGHDEFGWWAVAPGSGFPTWSVLRQDDTGNEFLVKTNLHQSEARDLVAEMESRGHKQIYWCRDDLLA